MLDRRGRSIEVVKYQLEIADPSALRPPLRPARRAFELEQVADPDLNRWFYDKVGAEYGWFDRLGWSDRQWRDWEARIETHMVLVESERAGYFELEPHPRSGFVQLAYFGLLAPYFGYGIGGHVLTAALRRGLEIAPRVAVSTNTRDHQHALANYEARGMRVIRQESGRVLRSPSPR